MSIPWKFIRTDPGEKYAILEVVAQTSAAVKLARGVPLLAEWPPEPPRISMDRHFKKNVAVADVMQGAGYELVVSQAFADVLQATGAEQYELLPVVVHDHKHQPVEGPYYVLNALHVVDAIDAQASDLLWNVMAPLDIAGVYELVLAAEKLPADARLIVLDHLKSFNLVHDALGEAMRRARLTGYRLVGCDEFMV